MIGNGGKHQTQEIPTTKDRKHTRTESCKDRSIVTDTNNNKEEVYFLEKKTEKQ